MSEITEVSADLVCFLCETPFITSSIPFILYKCSMCNEKSAYCFNCSKITNKLLGNALFRCSTCNNIVKAESKEEISKHSQNLDNFNNKIFSPLETENMKYNNLMKSSLMSNTSNPNIMFTNNSIQTPRNDISSYQKEFEENKSNFLDEFTNKLILHNNSSDKSNGVNFDLNSNKSNDNLLGSYDLLSKRKKNLGIKKAIQLNLNDLNNKSISSFDKNDSFHKKIKKFCTNGDSNKSKDIKSIFSNSSIENLSFLNGSKNIYKIPGFGEKNQIGNPKLTPHKFYVN
jgi:hypothetical protein